MTYAKTLGLGLLVAAMLAAGCGPKDKPATGGKPNTEAKSETKQSGKGGGGHSHGKGPNGGVVIDLGKHHAELTVDHKAKEMKVLFLGDDEKTPVAVAAKELTVSTKQAKTKGGQVVEPMTITLKPKDEKDGKATTFVGTDPGLGPVADHEGTVFGEIDGKPARRNFKEE